MLYYIIFILLGDLCEVKFSGRIIVVMSVYRYFVGRSGSIPPYAAFSFILLGWTQETLLLSGWTVEIHSYRHYWDNSPTKFHLA